MLVKIFILMLLIGCQKNSSRDIAPQPAEQDKSNAELEKLRKENERLKQEKEVSEEQKKNANTGGGSGNGSSTGSGDQADVKIEGKIGDNTQSGGSTTVPDKEIDWDGLSDKNSTKWRIIRVN